MRPFLLLGLCAGCTVHSTRSVDSTNLPSAVGRDNGTEVRLFSPSGRATGWLPSERLVVVGDTVCLRTPERAWARVQAIRIAQLTDQNIAAILVDLPREIPVVHRGGGVIELDTGGRDLGRWLRSVAHDPTDRGVPRYSVMAWQTWSGPFTWSALAEAGKPMLGWPIASTTAEVRHVNVAGTVALTALAVPVVLVAAGIAVVAHAPSPFPSDGSPQPKDRDSPSAADVPLAVAGAVIDASTDQPVSTWPPRPCAEVK